MISSDIFGHLKVKAEAEPLPLPGEPYLKLSQKSLLAQSLCWDLVSSPYDPPQADLWIETRLRRDI